MAAIAQTIAIVDRSGKVVSTSKQLKNVFKEAKLAYHEKKAEITSERRAKEDRELQKAIKAMSIADSESQAGSVRPTRHRTHSGRERGGPDLHVRPPTERHYSSASSVHSTPPRSPHVHSPARRTSSYRAPTLEEASHEYNCNHNRETSNPPPYPYPHPHELVRAQTDLPLTLYTQSNNRPRALSRANSTSAIDMDLAYGEYDPHLDPDSPINRRQSLTRAGPQEQQLLQKQEMSSLVLKCKLLLDEANCAQHSVKAIVAHLQSNPDAMAAVALTLAEISNLATKMAPGALSVLKAGAPSVFALLAAPEFLIAVGLAVGVTVVMFGGYKIVKKIRAAGKGEKGGGQDEMIDVDELSGIENWRRGIADEAFGEEDTRSVLSSNTSVEGEFITPTAARSLGHLPREGGRRREGRKEREGKEREGKEKKVEGKKSKSTSKRGSASVSSSSSSRLTTGDRDARALIKVKKPSPLRRMFTKDDRSSVAG